MAALPIVPFAFFQVSVTTSSAAPVKLDGVVIVNELGSVVSADQVPAPRFVPPLSVQPDGTPAMVTVMAPSAPCERSEIAKSIAEPATPAGAATKLLFERP